MEVFEVNGLFYNYDIDMGLMERKKIVILYNTIMDLEFMIRG